MWHQGFWAILGVSVPFLSQTVACAARRRPGHCSPRGSAAAHGSSRGVPGQRRRPPSGSSCDHGCEQAALGKFATTHTTGCDSCLSPSTLASFIETTVDESNGLSLLCADHHYDHDHPADLHQLLDRRESHLTLPVARRDASRPKANWTMSTRSRGGRCTDGRGPGSNRRPCAWQPSLRVQRLRADRAADAGRLLAQRRERLGAWLRHPPTR